MTSKATLVVVGDRTANEVREAAEATDRYARVLQYYFDPATIAEFASTLHDGEVVFNIGIADPELKAEIALTLQQQGWKPSTIIHPSAVVAKSASIGHGCFIAPLAVVSSNAVVGDGAIVHIHASVGHDVQLEENVAVLPGARISGNVVVGKNTIVGSNAFLAAGRSVGAGCRIDALAYVAEDLAAGFIASPRLDQPVRRVV